MRWRERSVHGRAVAIRAAGVAFVLGTGLLFGHWPNVVLVFVLVLAVCAFPLTIFYYEIACPRCGDRMLSPWQLWGDPTRCPKCGLPTNQAWQE